MSRRPNPANDRAAQNAQTLKALVKLEGNKVCADCKRNKHPRWASWNLGIFVCIRCSGIHRGMGTHISRVKSVDLDAWTDEQLQSVIKWGNLRANRYWEAKLAPGHVPSEAKIENFIRTKYDSKRWVMDGPLPDPATLGGDDDVPLSVVQEKAKIERSASQRMSGEQAATRKVRAAPAQNVNLFDDFTSDPPARPSTTDPPPARAPALPTVRAKPQESLLGLDFLGNQPQAAGIGRPTSAASTPVSTTNARGDLKNSILSLYASAPKPQPQQQQQPSNNNNGLSFGGMASPPAAKQDAFGGLTDAFGGMTFSNSTATRSPPPTSASSDFAGLNFSTTTQAKAAPAPTQVTSPPPPLSGGTFFDSMSSRPSSKPAPVSKPSSTLDFSFTQNTAPASPPPPPKQTITSMPADLFADDGFDAFASAPPAVTTNAPQSKAAPPVSGLSDMNSAFNLSAASAGQSKQSAAPARPPIISQSSTAMFDPWASGNDTGGWGAADPAPANPAAKKVELGSVPSHLTPNDISGGWGAPISNANKPTPQPTVTADEDFGGWTSAPAASAQPSKQGGGFGASDPFDNPWG